MPDASGRRRRASFAHFIPHALAILCLWEAMQMFGARIIATPRRDAKADALASPEGVTEGGDDGEEAALGRA